MKTKDCGSCKKYTDEGSVLYETENFYVAPTKGPLVEGYLLICSKEHYLSIGHLDDKLINELIELKKKTRMVLDLIYTDKTIFFEHGPYNESRKGGSCIDHMHLHALPLNIRYTSLPYNVNRPKTVTITSLKELKRSIKQKKDYVFFEDNFGEMIYFNYEGQLPCQYMRRLVAQAVNKEYNWDYEFNPEIKNFNQTLIRLSGKFS